MAGMEAWLPNDRSQQATQAATPPVKFLPSRAHKASLVDSRRPNPTVFVQAREGPVPSVHPGDERPAGRGSEGVVLCSALGFILFALQGLMGRGVACDLLDTAAPCTRKQRRRWA